jgi:GLPGLI family protein
MKNLLLSTTMLLLLQATQAQLSSGRIIYERKINLHRSITDEQTRATVPEFNITRYQLLFSDSLSVYKPVPGDARPDPFANGGPGMIIRMGPGDDGILFKNFSAHTMIEQDELEDKKYLVSDSLRQDPWKLGDETKILLNHVCKKATMKNAQDQNLTAWYATDIPTPAGPDHYGSLPGLIMQMDINDSEIVFMAQESTPNPDKREIKAPTDGKQISAADFRKKSEAILGAPGPGGRTVHTQGIN